MYERYLGVLTPTGQHIALSVTKSFVATMAATMISERRKDHPHGERFEYKTEY